MDRPRYLGKVLYLHPAGEKSSDHCISWVIRFQFRAVHHCDALIAALTVRLLSLAQIVAPPLQLVSLYIVGYRVYHVLTTA